MECGFGWSFCGGFDFDGRLGEVVDEVVAGFAGGWWVVGGGEETAFCVEVNQLGSADLFIAWSDDGFEVAEAGAGLFGSEFDAWGEAHVGFVEVDLLVGDFDHLVLGHAGGEDGAELLVIEEGECSA